MSGIKWYFYEMATAYRIFGLSLKEVFFQVLLHVVLFLFFSFDRNSPRIEEVQIAYFLDYAFGAFIINYYLLPHFYYKKKYVHFFFLLVLVIIGIILIDEFVVEQIYLPDTRGKVFPGVIYTLLQVMPIIIILSGFKFAWDASKKQREVDELKAAVKESELQFLKSQINPHFLFNNLNNLYSHAIENSPKTPSIILELSSVLRYILYDCREDFVPLSKEMEHLKNFTQLSELQIENRGKVNFKTSNIKSGYQIAPLILMVFIENAFKHSTASQSEDISIETNINVSDMGVLEFECKNSFRPVSNTDDLSNGIGLQNVRKRLEIIYPNDHELSIRETDGTYMVSLKMQLKT